MRRPLASSLSLYLWEFSGLPCLKLDISDDGFLSLMTDDGDTKDDVKLPDGEVGEKINRLFNVEEKDTSKFSCLLNTRLLSMHSSNNFSL